VDHKQPLQTPHAALPAAVVGAGAITGAVVVEIGDGMGTTVNVEVEDGTLVGPGVGAGVGAEVGCEVDAHVASKTKELSLHRVPAGTIWVYARELAH